MDVKVIIVNALKFIKERNHPKVINNIKPRMSLKFSIHFPGLGKIDTREGLTLEMIQGKANPNEINIKIKIMFWQEEVIEKPIAVPRNGALHGVAIKVEKTPDRK